MKITLELSGQKVFDLLDREENLPRPLYDMLRDAYLEGMPEVKLGAGQPVKVEYWLPPSRKKYHAHIPPQMWIAGGWEGEFLPEGAKWKRSI